MTADDKIILVAERIAERVPLMDISNLPSKEAVDEFIDTILGWVSDDPRLQLMLEDEDGLVRRDCVTEAVERTRKAISKFSSMAPKPDDYFWFMVQKIHGTEGAARLKSLSKELRKEAKKADQKVKVAA